MQAVVSNPGNPAEWWTVWVAVAAIALGLWNAWFSVQTRRDVNDPGWLVSVRPYIVSALVQRAVPGGAGGGTENLDRGSEWVIENVGRVEGRHIKVEPRWPRSMRLAGAKADIGAILEAGESNRFAHKPEPLFPQLGASDWPTVDEWQREISRLPRWRSAKVRISWRASSGRVRRRRVKVVVGETHWTSMEEQWVHIDGRRVPAHTVSRDVRVDEARRLESLTARQTEPRAD